MGGVTVGTLSPAFQFVALILVTNCRKTCVKPRTMNVSMFFSIFGAMQVCSGKLKLCF